MMNAVMSALRSVSSSENDGAIVGGTNTVGKSVSPDGCRVSGIGASVGSRGSFVGIGIKVSGVGSLDGDLVLGVLVGVLVGLGVSSDVG